MESVPVMENGYEHPGSDRMTRVGLLTCQRAVSSGLVLGGVGASLAILFLGLPIPSFFLFDLESMVFWALVLGSLILGVDAARSNLRLEQTVARSQVHQLKLETRAALQAVRGLARELGPAGESRGSAP